MKLGALRHGQPRWHPNTQDNIMSFVKSFALATAGLAGVGASAAPAASLTRSVVVRASPTSVWSLIGPYCAIKNWLPPVGSCTEDGQRPPTRTLVTKDGTATFVERQTARNDGQRFYSYTFVSSPLPVSHYTSTIKVTGQSNGQSIVTWSGSYTPDPGKAEEAKRALEGIYMAGLESIKDQAKQRFAHVAAAGSAP
jgi:hypothetical protein